MKSNKIISLSFALSDCENLFSIIGVKKRFMLAIQIFYHQFNCGKGNEMLAQYKQSIETIRTHAYT